MADNLKDSTLLVPKRGHLHLCTLLLLTMYSDQDLGTLILSQPMLVLPDLALVVPSLSARLLALPEVPLHRELLLPSSLLLPCRTRLKLSLTCRHRLPRVHLQMLHQWHLPWEVAVARAP